ncbi:hypothetical protein NXX54_04645 [Bacteroides sp. BFG-638]|uniref:hypothetical protein n=1 Tax=Bacteroides TaxID=816 RepID=UPI001F167B14|nr:MULTISPECIES: hypothetical protein [Bacteroides]MCE8924710.1 hypothetical protein [Bacteroides ovatus]MCS2334034.1 hypothetical protein [Bacteroides sp. BFG-606]MCS2947701.1 hypothetical protein [Bacteroides sp. BFG-638]MCS3311324.1 hypothetical protein [Bacteroides sp. BFG-637]
MGDRKDTFFEKICAIGFNISFLNGFVVPERITILTKCKVLMDKNCHMTPLMVAIWQFFSAG